MADEEQAAIFAAGRRRGRRSAVSAAPPKAPAEGFKPTVVEKDQKTLDTLHKIVGECLLFKHLDKKDLNVVVDAMFKVECAPEEVIIKQGDDGDNFYVMESGYVEIFVSQPDGSQLKVMTCSDGDTFGELALMYDAPRAATVIAKKPTVLWAVDRDTYKHILMSSTKEKRARYEEFLNKVPILSSMVRYDRLKVADLLEPVTFEKGAVILTEGDAGSTFYIIEDGSVVCTQKYDDGKEGELCRLSSGDYFGERALIKDEPRAATVKALETTHCLALSRETFDMVLGPLKDILKTNVELYKTYVEMAADK
eukprot:CAMPEP_0174233310 /NCGR_PEP_ID=MMETSP0417-20130205/3386_1 /TAXON_ID=242541 /ORGANISM="Mayorella sp, Strain BSH-02190019" /LENGTH=308 /DNA_ID=CAMNT_0015311497 /DNA_START=177 /DNA_END=1103 /DNA_ORIENTATION=-